MLHVAASGADGADGVGEGEGSGGDVSGIFAKGMACGDDWLDVALGEDSGCGDGELKQAWYASSNPEPKRFHNELFSAAGSSR